MAIPPPLATSATYVPTSTDVGSTIRLQVTASNASGKSVLYSTPAAVIAGGPAVAQMGDTSTGFEFFACGAGGAQIFTPRIYSVVSGKKGSLLGTAAAVSVPMGTNGQWYVSTLSGIQLTAGAQYMLALEPSGVKSTYVGAETSGEMAFFVDYTP